MHAACEAELKVIKWNERKKERQRNRMNHGCQFGGHDVTIKANVDTGTMGDKWTDRGTDVRRTGHVANRVHGYRPSQRHMGVLKDSSSTQLE